MAWLFRLAVPGNVLVVALCAAAVALLVRERRTSHLAVAACALALLCIAVLPLGSALLRPLEQRFPPGTPLPESVDCIVVLGGAFERSQILTHRRLGLNAAGDRLIAFVQLAHRYPSAQLYFAGGSGSLGPRGLGDALPAARFFEELGIPFVRVTLEESAENTHQNAVEAARADAFARRRAWILITSAWHMPRAVGSFRAAGLQVIPYSVDFREVPGIGFDLSGGLARLELALREWTALTYYRLRGRTDAWLPGPDAAP